MNITSVEERSTSTMTSSARSQPTSSGAIFIPSKDTAALQSLTPGLLVTTIEPTPTNNTKQDDTSGPNYIMIGLISFGGLILITGVVGFAFILRRNRKRMKEAVRADMKASTQTIESRKSLALRESRKRSSSLQNDAQSFQSQSNGQWYPSSDMGTVKHSSLQNLSNSNVPHGTLSRTSPKSSAQNINMTSKPSSNRLSSRTSAQQLVNLPPKGTTSRSNTSPKSSSQNLSMSPKAAPHHLSMTPKSASEYLGKPPKSGSMSAKAPLPRLTMPRQLNADNRQSRSSQSLSSPRLNVKELPSPSNASGSIRKFPSVQAQITDPMPHVRSSANSMQSFTQGTSRSVENMPTGTTSNGILTNITAPPDVPLATDASYKYYEQYMTEEAVDETSTQPYGPREGEVRVNIRNDEASGPPKAPLPRSPSLTQTVWSDHPVGTVGTNANATPRPGEGGRARSNSNPRQQPPNDLGKVDRRARSNSSLRQQLQSAGMPKPSSLDVVITSPPGNGNDFVTPYASNASLNHNEGRELNNVNAFATPHSPQNLSPYDYSPDDEANDQTKTWAVACTLYFPHDKGRG